MFSLLTSAYGTALAQNQVRLTYQFEGSHYVGLLNIVYDFRGTEELTITASGGGLTIDQLVTGKVRWPTTVGGFTAAPYSKWIEYLDQDGNVQRHIDVLQDDMATDFSFHNVVTVSGNVVTGLGGDRVGEARVFINFAPREGFLFWSWVNPLWPGQGYLLSIGKRNAGEIVSAWVPKWLVPAKTYADPAAVPLKLGSDLVVGEKAFPTLTGQAVYVANHPSKPGSEYLFAGYELTLTETMYWDRGTGILLREQLIGVSNNPMDTSHMSLSHALVSLSSIGAPEQVRTTTAAAPPVKVATTSNPTVQIVQPQPAGPPLILVVLAIVLILLVALVLLQRRRPQRRRRR